ncbi:uncharacterized protein JCM6883_006183 [Sporobolomyces salmoneus]|uniref:uncharacterized protein n=1 Tax=Sporobolomyces salmoneus TaxID=183962 RepID=UPI00316B4914
MTLDETQLDQKLDDSNSVPSQPAPSLTVPSRSPSLSSSEPSLPPTPDPLTASPSISDQFQKHYFPNPAIPLERWPEILDPGSSRPLFKTDQTAQNPGHNYDIYLKNIRNVIYISDFNVRHEKLVEDFVKLNCNHLDDTSSFSQELFDDSRTRLDKPLTVRSAYSEATLTKKAGEMVDFVGRRLLPVLDGAVGRSGTRRLDWVPDKPTSNRVPRPDIVLEEISTEGSKAIAVFEMKGFGSFLLKEGLSVKLQAALNGSGRSGLQGIFTGEEILSGRGQWTEDIASFLLKLVVGAMHSGCYYFIFYTAGSWQLGKIVPVNGPNVSTTASAKNDASRTDQAAYGTCPPFLCDVLIGPLELSEQHPSFKGRMWDNNEPSTTFLNALANHEELGILKNKTKLIPILLGLCYPEVYEGVNEAYSDILAKAETDLKAHQAIRAEEREGEHSLTSETPEIVFEFEDDGKPATFFKRRSVSRQVVDDCAVPTGQTQPQPDSPPRPHKNNISVSSPLRPNDATPPPPELDNSRFKLPPVVALGRKIGDGLTSEVYRAIDYPLVVKFAVPHTGWDEMYDRVIPNGREGAYVEASLLSNHLSSPILRPFIVQLLYFSKNEARRWDNIVTVMEDGGDCLEGFESLEAKEKRHLAIGLHLIHCFGVHHRDVKPSNVVRTSGSLPKFIDFANAASQHRCPGSMCKELQEFMDELEIDSVDERREIRKAASKIFSRSTSH